MSKGLLMSYIRLALAEAQQARVPNQLLSVDDESSEEEDVNELNAIFTGALMGHAGDGHEEDDR